MKWNKLGLVYVANGQESWAKTAAFLPTPLIKKDGIIRVFCSFWDKDGVGRIGYVDVEKDDPSRVVNVSRRPVLDIGIPGTFDDNGVAPSSVIEYKEKIYLFYVGFQLQTRIRYTMMAGLAYSDDGGNTFTRVKKVPFLERTDSELFSRTAPHVLKSSSGFHLWYIGGSDWIEVKGKKVPVYNIKYVPLDENFNFIGNPSTVLDITEEDVHGYGRPYVVLDNGTFRMFYSIRYKSKGYRLGYAESKDGLRWNRMDSKIGISPSESGWDSETVEYSSIVNVDGNLYMFFNGNGMSKTGFGLAKMISDD